MRNTGADTAQAVVVEDELPATAVDGSIRLDGTGLSDAQDADAAEVVGNRLRARLGDVAPGAERTVAIRVRVPATAAVGSEIANLATAAFRAPATGATLAAQSNRVAVTVAVTPVTPVAPAPVAPAPARAVLPAQVISPPKLEFAKLVSLPSTRRCVSRRRFRIRLRQPGGDRIVRALVRVNGKRVRVVRGRRLRAPVNLQGLPKGRFK